MNKLLGAFIFTALLGWVASIILTAIHFWVIPILPTGADLAGPMLVITSEWAYIGPVPLAVIGAVYYIVMIVMGSLWLSTKNETILGFLASLGFVYLQLFVIGAICPFCMMSAAATTILLGIELVVKFNGGAATAPSLQAQKVWAAVFMTTTLLTIFAMWSLTVLPLPVPGS